MDNVDLAVVGSGFGGSLLAMIARRLGLSVVLLERGVHPRFAIGESTSPLANLLIEELAGRYDLPRLLPLTSWGAWQRTYPELGGGLKRGFTFYGHEPNRPYRIAPDRANQLLVAASPADVVADTHWLRADVDHFLVREAMALGAEYSDEVQLDTAQRNEDGVTLRGKRKGKPLAVCARLVIDATGPRGFLHRALDLPEASFTGYPATQTLFSHFTGVHRCETLPAFGSAGTPPYPPDDAALHHVFPGGWMWVLRFGTGVTSAGITVTDSLAHDLGLSEGEPAWRRFLTRFPSIAEQFADATAVEPFRYSPRLAYRSSRAAGDGWALLPSAAAFIDPLFSTGIPLTLLGIERLGRILEGEPTEWNRALTEYEQTTLEEADWVARFIGGCYAAFATFPRFAGLSMFYFVASSYAEMARRLGKPQRAGRFLAADDSRFRAGFDACVAALEDFASPNYFGNLVAGAVADRNVAGLCDPDKRNWYGVDLNDVVQGAAKLGHTPEAMRAILAVAEWARVPQGQYPATIRSTPL